MNEPIDRSHETNSENIDYQAQIDAITDRVLTPENIDIYASDALDDLVNLVDEIVSSQNYKFPFSSLENEHQALAGAGLDPGIVERILDHIADVAKEIDDIDKYIEKYFNNGDVVVTPTRAMGRAINPGDGSFREKQRFARLKTILTLLSREFGIDLEDDSQIYRIPGKVKPGMMRQLPYNLLDLPTLNRMIDVCDEEGNRTFVFDREKVLALGYTATDIANMDKEELKALIEANSMIGAMIVYNDSAYVNKIVHLLTGIDTVKSDGHNDTDRLLKPKAEKAPEGILSAEDIAQIAGVHVETVRYICRGLKQELGEARRYEFAPHSYRRGYRVDQQNIIFKRISELTNIREKSTPKENRTLSGIQRETGIHERRLRKAVDALGEGLGEVEEHIHGTRPQKSYNPVQQNMIIAEASKDILPERSSGRLTVPEITDLMGMKNTKSAEKILDEAGILYKIQLVNNSPSRTYDEEEVKTLIDKRQSFVSADDHSVRRAHEIGPEWGVSYGLVGNTARKYHMPLGTYQFGDRPATGYTPRDEAFIHHVLEENGNFAPELKEGEYTYTMAAQRIRHAIPTIKKVVDILKEHDSNFGEIEKRKSKSQPVDILSEEQLEKVDEYLMSGDYPETKRE